MIVIIIILIVVLAVPGFYNLYVYDVKSKNSRDTTKYAFDYFNLDSSGVADVISAICAVLTCVGVVCYAAPYLIIM